MMEQDYPNILPVCKICKKEFKMVSGLKRHLTRIEQCRTAYGEEYDQLQQLRSNQQKSNKRKYYVDHSEEIKDKVKQYKAKNMPLILQKEKERINQKRVLSRSRMTSADRILKFKIDIKDGPNYVCQCCKRSLFLSGVKLLTNEQVKSLEESCSETLLSTVLNGMPLRKDLIMCHNCFYIVSKTQKMPRICEANGLRLDDIPPELKVNELENQFFAKSLVFMKIKTLPSVPRMNAVYDRVINVPLTDEDINSTIEKLPRLPEKAKVIVQLKRKMELKSVEASVYINPDKIRKAIEKLQSLENRFYHNVSIDEHVMKQLEVHPMAEPSDEEMDDKEIAESEKEHDKGVSLTDCSTSLIPRNMEADVVVNDKQHISITCPDSIIKVAPGEGKSNNFSSILMQLSNQSLMSCRENSNQYFEGKGH